MGEEGEERMGGKRKGADGREIPMNYKGAKVMAGLGVLSPDGSVSHFPLLRLDRLNLLETSHLAMLGLRKPRGVLWLWVCLFVFCFDV